ncbi:MAG: hypothetical protein IJR25_01740 [Bacteroidales bacterium]|nr:hypothetical protein [Bacteroidales bacterium]
MKAGIKILCLAAVMFAVLGCEDMSGMKPADPVVVNDGDIVILDLSQWRDITAKDSLGVVRLWETMHLTSTLQGIVNRDQPRLYIKYISTDGVEVDQFWWDKCVGDGKWLSGRRTVTMYDPVKVLDLFRDKIQGMVVYDPAVASTSCVASTVAGAEDCVAVRYDMRPGSVYTRLVKREIPVKVWLLNQDGTSKFHTKLEPYRWAVDNYLKTGKCSGETAGYYIDQYWMKQPGNAGMNHHQLTNHDYFVSHKGFIFDLSPWDDEPASDAIDEGNGDRDMFIEILREINILNGGQRFCHVGGFAPWAHKYSDNFRVTHPSKHAAAQTEWEVVYLLSAFNAYKDADAASYGAMANASFWQHYPVKESYPQGWVTREQLKARGYINANGRVNTANKYVLFYVGDYDAAAWIYQKMPTLWEDPSRGSVPMMWSINPSLARRAPMIMDYMRTTATDMDYFAAGDNGAGYLNPGMLEEPRPVSGLPSGVAAWAAHNKAYYEQWGLSVTGFVIDGNGPGMSNAGFKAYATFSPNGICPQRLPDGRQTYMVDGMPMLRCGGASVGADRIEDAGQTAISMVQDHPDLPFYWIRTILKSPTWHKGVKDYMESADNKIVVLDGPSWYELLRCYLEQ